MRQHEGGRAGGHGVKSNKNPNGAGRGTVNDGKKETRGGLRRTSWTAVQAKAMAEARRKQPGPSEPAKVVVPQEENASPTPRGFEGTTLADMRLQHREVVALLAKRELSPSQKLEAQKVRLQISLALLDRVRGRPKPVSEAQALPEAYAAAVALAQKAAEGGTEEPTELP